jgi:hypothetical protein
MQLIAEAYDRLKHAIGRSDDDLVQTFRERRPAAVWGTRRPDPGTRPSQEGY